MFTLRVIVIRMSKIAHFFVFSGNDSKTFVTLGAKYLSASERSNKILSENAMDCCHLIYR